MILEIHMNAIFQKIKASLLSHDSKDVEKIEHNQQVNPDSGIELDARFPKGYHVFGITTGPSGDVMVGVENPMTSLGSIFIRKEDQSWKEIALPDETAWLSRFIRLKDKSYIASGMSLIGRAAILKGDAKAENWKSIDMDLHSYSAINSLVHLPNGELIASTGHMITQGKTKPILLRSKDEGVTWEKEEIKLPITQFHTFYLDENRLYAGTCGDHDPVLYYSDDFAKTWNELPKLPSYKTYKTTALQPVTIDGKKRLIALMWGYKLDIADRVVRMYISDESFQTWTEQPEILDSHFIFSFYVTKEQTFYAGSEKGLILKSKDFGHSWETVEKLTTNIGAYTIYEDKESRIWFGKDFVEPNHQSLWKLKQAQ